MEACYPQLSASLTLPVAGCWVQLAISDSRSSEFDQFSSVALSCPFIRFSPLLLGSCSAASSTETSSLSERVGLYERFKEGDELTFVDVLTFFHESAQIVVLLTRVVQADLDLKDLFLKRSERPISLPLLQYNRLLPL